MNTSYATTNKGFTLIELLVAISIISILSSIALASMSESRSRARDAKIKADLQQIEVALEFYYDRYGTYRVYGAGWMGGGYANSGHGWFDHESADYPVSIARALRDLGFYTAIVVDTPAGGLTQNYMLYTCNNGQVFAIFATLENPTADDIASSLTACTSAYTTAAPFYKNYVRFNKPWP